MSLKRLGIMTGEKLVFRNRNSIFNGTEVIVLNEIQVLYNGIPYSLSTLAQQFLKSTYPVNGSQYFTYNGKRITDLRELLEFNQKN